jgi:hypothetical protein
LRIVQVRFAEELNALEAHTYERLHGVSGTEQLFEVVGELEATGGDARFEVQVAVQAALIHAHAAVQGIEAALQPGGDGRCCPKLIANACDQGAVAIML